MKKLFSIVWGMLFVLICGNENVFPKSLYYYYHDSKVYLSEVPGHYAAQFLETLSGKEKLSYLRSLNLEILSFNSRPEGYCVVKIQNPALLSSLSRSSFISHLSPLLEFGDGMKCIIPNRFIVKFKPHIAKAEIEALNQKNGASIVQEYPYRDNIYILSADSAGSLAALEMANQYHQFPEVDFAEPDIMMSARTLSIVPNDPLFIYQWYLDQIKAPDAWEISRGSESVVAAVLDEGVDLLHEDLINRFFRDGSGNIIGIDVTDQGDNSPHPNKANAHGTACSGIIAAETDNQTGVAGINWYSKIMPVQIFYRDVEPFSTWTSSSNFKSMVSWTAMGIDYAWQNGADILSMSFSSEISSLIDLAIQEAATLGRSGLGCILVAASGNSGGNIDYPANLDQYVIAVGATDENDERWYYSNYGTSLDVVAPSGDASVTDHGYREVCPIAPPPPHIYEVFKHRGNIWTADQMGEDPVTGDHGYSDDNCYHIYASPGPGGSEGKYTAKFGGTSAACPQVAGLASLILAINPDLTREEVQDVIQNSADVVDAMQGQVPHPEYGYGRINAYEALKEAFPIKITGDITTGTTWTSGDYALFKNPNVPPTTVQYFVDGVDLTIGAGAVVVVEENVRVLAINGGHITIDPGAKIIEEPGGEIIAGSGGFVTDNGGDIRFGGTGACMATAGGILKFASGVTRTVDNGGVIASFGSGGSIVIENNASLVFESNSKLFLEPGALVRLGDNAEITSEGEIDALGTAVSPITFTALYPPHSPNEYWKWLKLDGSQDSDPPPERIFDYATIEYAGYGIHATQVSDLTLTNNTIQNCENGNVYLNNSYAYFDNNQIYSNTGIGNGIYLYNSSPVFYNNFINENNGAGVFCYNYSSPEFGASTSTAYGANVLAGNAYGVRASYYSNPFLGEEIQLEGPIVLYGGYNSIYGNSSFAVKAEQNCDITAQYNWWGSYPADPEIFDIGEDCTIDYSNALPFDPNQESSALTAGGSVSERSGSSSLPTENFTPRQLLKLAKKFRVQKRPGLALPVYKQLILNHPNRVEARWGLIELVSTFKEAGRDSAVAYLLHTIATHPNFKMQRVAFDMLTGEYLEKRNASAAVANAQQVVSNYPTTESEKTTLFDLVNTYFHNLNNPAQAQSYLSQLESKYPNDELTFHAQMLMGGASALPKSPRKPGELLTGTKSPAGEFMLESNYPNPFNPATNIRYHVPRAARVKITVYNLLGEEVRQLVDETVPEGIYEITWDGKTEWGSIVGSGTYFLYLSAVSGQRQFSDTKKIVLMK